MSNMKSLHLDNQIVLEDVLVRVLNEARMSGVFDPDLLLRNACRRVMDLAGDDLPATSIIRQVVTAHLETAS